MRVQRLMASGGVVLMLCMGAARANEPSPEQIKFFESKVRPLLVENCFSCHTEKKQKGGLRLDSLEAAVKGGKAGPALVPGKPGESRIIEAVSYKNEELQMPPDGKLSDEQIAVLTQWVQMGAPWGKDVAAASPVKVHKTRTIKSEDRTFWSFVPPKAQVAPQVEGVKHEVDAFIRAKLKAEGLSTSPEADRVTLVRRAYFDLHGLPPTPEEVAAFVNDRSPDAWEKLIDRLLASPRYGERWGRYWLDVVRYAESDGYKQDSYRPNVWPYRDYVIRSFNEDKPYDQFVREHLAGDELNAGDPDTLIATAYLRHGIYEYNQADAKGQWAAILDELTDVTADVFLGLSMGCAKCHDHKFDPILQKDYYRLRAFFAPIVQRHDLPLATREERAKYGGALKKWEEKTADLRAKIAAFEKDALEKARQGAIEKFPPDVRDLINKPAEERTPYEEQIVQLAGRQLAEKMGAVAPKLPAKEKAEYDALRAKLTEFEGERPKPPLMAFVATDIGPNAPPTHVPGHQDEVIPPGYPVVLSESGLSIPTIAPTQNSTGRRTALANWLTQPNHPLTSRVIVNRIWQHHFGRGIVGTSSDFGTLGDRPTHPELLDHLATRFVADGWSFKKMHRLIMTSAAYRQASHLPTPAEAKVKDPENKLLWKYTARRLDAEQVRDAMLLASGELKFDQSGPAVDAVQPRRSIYTKAWRNNRDPLLDAFDLPDAFGSAPSRNATVTPMQSLLLINGDWPLKRAESMAGRLRQMKLKSPEETVVAAWNLAYNRPPTQAEKEAALAFLARKTTDHGPRTTDATIATTVDTKPVLKQMPQLGSQAVYVRQARADDMLRLSPTGMPDEDFTVEAYILLDSIYEDASVRVIASQWDGKPTSPGWSFGVTSTKSKHQPRNLILQLTDGGGYEVIPSDFRIELHKTYYVAVSVRLKDTSENGITFYLKDITDMDAPLRSVGVKHRLTGGIQSPGAALVLGGRDSTPVNGWDGLIDEVRISRKALAKEQLLYNDGLIDRQNLVGHWLFEDTPGIFKDSAGHQKDLAKRLASASSPAKSSSGDANLVDLCHVLLNSNEFLHLP